MFLLKLLFFLARALAFGRGELVIENLALRQQLAVFKRERPRPPLAEEDRAFWVVLRQTWRGWLNALIVVDPATVVAWHRRGFRRYWHRLSRPAPRAGRPRVTRELRELIRRLVLANPTWGAPRVHGELRMLGFAVSERTVSRYLPKRPADPDLVARWRTFLRNHREVLAAMDLFIVPTAAFRVLYVLVVIHHARRRLLHVNVTAHPTAAWILQQLREAFPLPFAERLRYLIFDRDSTFSHEVVAAVKRLGLKPVRTSSRSPWQNGVCERWIRTCRRELLAHVVVLNELHLLRLLREFVAYYHADRTHLSLGKDTPDRRAVQARPPSGEVVALARVGGLHHRYEWRQAA